MKLFKNIHPLVLLIVAVSLPLPAPAASPVVPLLQAHAHNDYAHAHPLHDALGQGFCGVEADVWLVDGQLLVAHDRRQVRPDRTLQALYLDPLRERVRENGGRVYPDGPSITLLIDLKSDAVATYQTLEKILEPYHPVLTRFESKRTETNAVTVVVSGNRPKDLMLSERMRWAGYDGRLADLDTGWSPHFMPLVSDNWTLHFQWRGRGEMSAADQRKLSDLVAKAHHQGYRLRFWSIPDFPAGWRVLQDAGVDLINTDNLAGFAKFSAEERAKSPSDSLTSPLLSFPGALPSACWRHVRSDRYRRPAQCGQVGAV